MGVKIFKMSVVEGVESVVEEWRKVEGFPKYEVSSLGRVATSSIKLDIS